MKSSTTLSTAARASNGTSELHVHTLTAADQERFNSLLAQHHPLGPTQAVGDFLRQVVTRNAQWVALLVGGPAPLKLKDRNKGRHVVAGVDTLAAGRTSQAHRPETPLPAVAPHRYRA